MTDKTKEKAPRDYVAEGFTAKGDAKVVEGNGAELDRKLTEASEYPTQAEAVQNAVIENETPARRGARK